MDNLSLIAFYSPLWVYLPHTKSELITTGFFLRPLVSELAHIIDFKFRKRRVATD